MKLLLLLAVLAAFIMASQENQEEKKIEEENYDWAAFKEKFNRNYSGDEEVRRKAIFDANVEKIKAHNEKYKQKQVTYTMGINQFADKTPEEITPLFGLKLDAKNKGATAI